MDISSCLSKILTYIENIWSYELLVERLLITLLSVWVKNKIEVYEITSKKN